MSSTKRLFSAIFMVLSTGVSGQAYALSDECKNALIKASESAVLSYCDTKKDKRHPEVQYVLGKIYYEGKLVEGDFATARKHFKAAQKEGNVNATSALGTLHYFGAGVELDTSKAAELYLDAARKGSADAQMRYGVMLSLGQGGLKRNQAEALRWFDLAAKRGNGAAALNLGYAYLKGIGTEESATKAYIFLSAAIAAGRDEQARPFLSELNEKLEGINRTLLNEQATRFIEEYVKPYTPGNAAFEKKKAESLSSEG